MLHIVESRKPEAVARHHFGVLGVHDLKAVAQEVEATLGAIMAEAAR